MRRLPMRRLLSPDGRRPSDVPRQRHLRALLQPIAPCPSRGGVALAEWAGRGQPFVLPSYRYPRSDPHRPTRSCYMDAFGQGQDRGKDRECSA